MTHAADDLPFPDEGALPWMEHAADLARDAFLVAVGVAASFAIISFVLEARVQVAQPAGAWLAGGAFAACLLFKAAERALERRLRRFYRAELERAEAATQPPTGQGGTP